MDDQSMARWWNHGLLGEDRDKWCSALDTGVISEDLLITLTDEQRRWLVDSPDNPEAPGPMMTPELQAFVAEECSKRIE